MRYDYKPSHAFPDILAAQANGWVAWKRDATGVQWLRRPGAFPDVHASDDDGEVCEFFEIDASGQRIPISGILPNGAILGVVTPESQDAEAGDDFLEPPIDVQHLPYWEMVEQRAAGEDIDAELGTEILEAAGRSMADFNSDVARSRAVNAGVDPDDPLGLFGIEDNDD